MTVLISIVSLLLLTLVACKLYPFQIGIRSTIDYYLKGYFELSITYMSIDDHW